MTINYENQVHLDSWHNISKNTFLSQKEKSLKNTELLLQRHERTTSATFLTHNWVYMYFQYYACSSLKTNLENLKKVKITYINETIQKVFDENNDNPF